MLRINVDTILEGIVCTFLKTNFRQSITRWIYVNVEIPVVTPILILGGWISGLVLDIVVPLVVIGGLSITMIGIPIVFLLVAKALTIDCD